MAINSNIINGNGGTNLSLTSPIQYTIIFYGVNGDIISQQSLTTVTDKEMSLKELIERGIVLPNEPTMANKVFIKWDVFYEESTNIYHINPKFVGTNIEESYYNSRLDDVDNDVNNHINDMELHIVDQSKAINKSNSTVTGLQDTDGDITYEINYVKTVSLKNTQLLDDIDDYDFDGQFSDVYDEIDRVQDEITDMDISHKADLDGLDSLILDNDSRLNNIQEKISSVPKHVILSEIDFKSISTPDRNAIYFTEEIN